MFEWREFVGKTTEEALTEALLQLGTTSDSIETEVLEKETSGFLGLAKKPARIRVRMKYTVESCVKEFLRQVFQAMGIEATVEVLYQEDEDTVDVNINGEDMGILIGKRGQTLDSLQYLVSLVVNKNSEKYLKVKVDTENYRERRKETLENLAKNIASRVKKSRKPVTLEPMNPYERRIIHSTLQGDRYVETHSEGEEPYRKVVVTMKKGVNPPYSGGYAGKTGGGYAGKNGTSKTGGSDYGKKFNNKEFRKKYGANTKDYSVDYKRDYAAYLEEKAAARAAEAEKKVESES